MGDIREDKGKILVARHAQERAHFVSTCESCQMHLGVRHRNELHRTYPPTVHFKWMVDLVTMPMGEGQKRYLVLAREDLTSQVGTSTNEQDHRGGV